MSISRFEAWIGNCHLRQIEGEEEYQCQAAVWADSVDTFRARLAQHIESGGLKILWLEECHPVSQYLQRHGNTHKIGALARAVHQGHHVELSRLAALGEAGKPKLSENYLTITEHEFEPLPDQKGIPFWDQEWIAPELKDLLFGQPADGPRLRTYWIVNASLRKHVTKVFDLDSPSIDVPMQCLFKGDAAQDWREIAPYLLDMTLPDGAWEDRDLVPSFHKDFFKKHWGKNTGIFIRTTALMSEVWNHYRKFTLVDREGHKGRVFVAFWSEQYVRLYFPHIADNQDRVAMWFLRDGFSIHSMLAEQDGGRKVNGVMLNRELFAQHNTPPTPFIVTEYDLEPFQKERDNKDLLRLVEEIRAGFSRELKNYSSEAIHQIVADPIARMRDYGFSQKANLYLLGAWSIFFGKSFEKKDPDGRLLAICESDMTEIDKMAALKQRMAQLGAPRETAS